jgi:hypothetical protein
MNLKTKRGGGAFTPVLGGTAVVYCLHDRQKGIVVTEAAVAELGAKAGLVLDPKQHKLFSCACCRNLFVDVTDEPRYCHVCRQPLIHMPAGPLATPTGRL